tara:strand:- start:204 stop:470 length:267 start_codon:yes stop_codon:yes gene_type:complete
MTSFHNDEIALSRLFSNLYTELFQRGSLNENTTIKKTSHNIENVHVTEHFQTVLHTIATMGHVWGPGGSSPYTLSSSMAAEWGLGFWA